MFRFRQDDGQRQRRQRGSLPLMTRRAERQGGSAHGHSSLARQPVIRARRRTGHVPTHRAPADVQPPLPGVMPHPAPVCRPDPQPVA